MSYDIYMADLREGREPGEQLSSLMESEAEERAADSQLEDIELRSEAEEHPVVVEFESNHIIFSVPYSLDRIEAGRLFSAIIEDIADIEQRTGWKAFDPQLERLVSGTRDIPDMLELYEATRT